MHLSPTEEALRILCDSRLHRHIWLPKTSSHDRLRVTYSTTCNFDDGSLPVALLCGPMYGTRWLAVNCDAPAQKHGVRMICVDRPNMGGSTEAPLEARIRIWLETVPLLLQTLGVRHVSLLSHSAGTIYLLNTLHHLPSLLNPHAPIVALVAPWVSTELSNAGLMSIVSKLPHGMVRSMDSAIRLLVNGVMPASAWSGGLISLVGKWLPSNGDVAQENVALRAETYGVSDEVALEIERLQLKFMFAESTKGANDEAVLLLRKTDVGWGACDDLDSFATSLREQEEARLSHLDDDAARLRMMVFYADSDILIGKGGQRYFESIWTPESTKKWIDYTSQELPHTDHDNVLFDFDNGALGRILQEISTQA